MLPLVVCLAAIFASGQDKAQIDPQKCWEQPMAEGRAMASDGIDIYISRSGGRLDAFAMDGRKVWTADLGGEISSNVVVTPTGVAVATTGGGSSVLRSLSKETGVTQWTFRLPAADEHSIGISRGGLVVVSGNGAVERADPSTGSSKWKREIASGFAGPAVFVGERVLVASTAKQLFVLSGATGDIEFLDKRENQPTGFTIVDNNLLVGDERGNITSTPIGAAKPTWRLKTGGKVSMIGAVEGQVLIASYDNFVYWVNPANGSIRWKRRLTGRASSLGIVSSQYLLSAATDDHSAALSDLMTGRVAGQIGLVGDEVVVADPVADKNEIVVLTSSGPRSFSLDSCSKKESGPGL